MSNDTTAASHVSSHITQSSSSFSTSTEPSPSNSSAATKTTSTTSIISPNSTSKSPPQIQYIQYSLALEPHYLPQIRALIAKDLSEPYSIYVYRYFLYQWPDLCFLALDISTPLAAEAAADPSTSLSLANATAPSLPAPASNPSKTQIYTLAGIIISKLEPHPPTPLRGYIAMLATATSYRNTGIARTLVLRSLDLLKNLEADEIVLETEEGNTAAMALYEGLGFVRSKKLFRYYLNGSCAFRLVLRLREAEAEGEGGGEGGLERGIV